MSFTFAQRQNFWTDVSMHLLIDHDVKTNSNRPMDWETLEAIMEMRGFWQKSFTDPKTMTKAMAAAAMRVLSPPAF